MFSLTCKTCPSNVGFVRSFSHLFQLPAKRKAMDTPMDIRSWRAMYLNHEEPFLLEKNLTTKNPFELFDSWFKHVASHKEHSFEEVNAVCLSTVGKDLRPASRMVLLKGYNSESGFSFYTNSTSRKGRQLEENPHAAMLFYWPRVHRQIRIEGSVERLAVQDAVDYWNTRPLASRIGSKSSDQSTVIPNREFLTNKKEELENLAERDGPEAITKPETWLGYRLIPRYFEFWQGQSDRLHDRIVFDVEKEEGSEDVGGGWHMYRLSP